MAIKISYLTEKEDVYDVTVKDNHNFYANEILVHNCSEIIEATDKDRTAVCCLSSVNLEYFDEWKDDELFIRDIAEMLDNVLQYFIDHAPDTVKRAKYSAFRERSIGVGALGFHAYLQSKNVPWESAVASSINTRIFSHIREKLDVANYQLAVERGEPPDIESEVDIEFTDDYKQTFKSSFELMKIISNKEYKNVRAFELKAGDLLSPSSFSHKIDYPREIKSVIKKAWAGRRFTHTSAIAPNATSSIIMGNTSPSIEPFRANAYRQDTLSGSFLNKNKYLDKLLDEKKLSEDEKADIWSSIIANDGSVQHLDILTDDERNVFKTSMEIDQRWVIEHAARRQAFIDQAQSLNLFFRPDAHIKYLHACHFLAWKRQLKTLYYCRSEKLAKADKVSKRIEREVIKELDMSQIAAGEVCLACEG